MQQAALFSAEGYEDEYQLEEVELGGGGDYIVPTYVTFASEWEKMKGAASATETFTIDKATPIVTVSDASGSYSSLSFAATDTVAGVVTGVDDTPAATLEGVGLNLTYYVGNDASGTDLGSTAPCDAGS